MAGGPRKQLAYEDQRRVSEVVVDGRLGRHGDAHHGQASG